jgi:phenylalanyl-tRNA synthetase alpha chain
MMVEQIKSYLTEIENTTISNAQELEQFRIKFLSRKGILQNLFDEFKNVPSDKKKDTGIALNTLKKAAQDKVQELEEKLSTTNESKKIDLTPTEFPVNLGSRHPISLVKNEIISIFKNLGFTLSDGPEVENDWHVFSALNFADDHPARDMQDTFFIEKNPDILLRTHTSSVQVRVMENQQPPIRTISPGRVFRNEAVSARAHCIFHQIEGLYVDTNVSFSDLKQTLLYFAKEFFGNEVTIRLRPSFFPFTEPSAEMDVSCSLCGGKGCNVCKHTGWLEVLGCGMVDPNVLDNCGIDSKKYSGFAFGMGVERIAMLKYEVRDLRLYFENDVRFLNQFKSGY